MANIRANCPDCAHVEFGSQEIVVLHCTTDDTWSYSFNCPGCGRRTPKAAERRIVDLLVSCGVPTLEWSAPAREPVSAAPSLTDDDCIVFHDLLSEPDWESKLLGTS